MPMIVAAASSQWINLSALWKICVIGLLAGAGLPALFAIGLRALSMTGSRAPAASGGPAEDRMMGGGTAGAVIATLCFLAVLAGVAWGIYSIVAGS